MINGFGTKWDKKSTSDAVPSFGTTETKKQCLQDQLSCGSATKKQCQNQSQKGLRNPAQIRKISEHLGAAFGTVPTPISAIIATYSPSNAFWAPSGSPALLGSKVTIRAINLEYATYSSYWLLAGTVPSEARNGSKIAKILRHPQIESECSEGLFDQVTTPEAHSERGFAPVGPLLRRLCEGITKEIRHDQAQVNDKGVLSITTAPLSPNADALSPLLTTPNPLGTHIQEVSGRAGIAANGLASPGKDGQCITFLGTIETGVLWAFPSDPIQPTVSEPRFSVHENGDEAAKKTALQGTTGIPKEQMTPMKGKRVKVRTDDKMQRNQRKTPENGSSALQIAQTNHSAYARNVYKSVTNPAKQVVNA